MKSKTLQSEFLFLFYFFRSNKIESQNLLKNVQKHHLMYSINYWPTVNCNIHPCTDIMQNLPKFNIMTTKLKG